MRAAEAATDFKGQTARCGVEGRLLPRSWSAGWLAARCDEREEDDGGKEGKTASYMGVIVVEEGFFI